MLESGAHLPPIPLNLAAPACVACLGGGWAGFPRGAGTMEIPEGADVVTPRYLRVANDLGSPTLESLVGELVHEKIVYENTALGRPISPRLAERGAAGVVGSRSERRPASNTRAARRLNA